MPKIDYNCTTAKMAEQLDIPLWKAMEMVKFARRGLLVEDIEKIIKDKIQNIPIKGQINPCNAIYLNEGAIKGLAQTIYDAQPKDTEEISQ